MEFVQNKHMGNWINDIADRTLEIENCMLDEPDLHAQYYVFLREKLPKQQRNARKCK